MAQGLSVDSGMARRRRSSQAIRAAKKEAKLKGLLHAPQPQPIQGLQTHWTGIGADTPPGFYVYRLIDPRDDRTFYIGKGQSARAWQHERLVRAGQSTSNTAKCERIRQIIAAGRPVKVLIEASYMLESDALEHEWRLIDGLSGLTNLMPGGIGAAQTPEQVTRRQLLRQRKLDELRRREREEARLREIDRNASRLAGVDTNEGREWLESLRQSSVRLNFTVRSSTGRSKAALAAFRATKPR